jgi:hypothetical protein
MSIYFVAFVLSVLLLIVFMCALWLESDNKRLKKLITRMEKSNNIGNDTNKVGYVNTGERYI